MRRFVFAGPGLRTWSSSERRGFTYRQTGQGREANIRLRKRIPHGAGLGGGSSGLARQQPADLNELCRSGLTTEDLVRLGAEIGSDVPFFLHRSAAWCRGRGEVVSPEAFRESFAVVLLKPEFGVPASMAYLRWADARELSGFSYQPQTVKSFTFVNDLETPVFEKFPILAELKRWLQAQPEVAAGMMSGSGSTMFAVLRDDQSRGEDLILRARAEIDPRLWATASRTRGQL